jgi:hypothetical protein
MPAGSGNNNISRYTFLLCAGIMCYASFFFYPRWKQAGPEAAISWDVSGYYWYLPSIFIYHDLKHQGFKDSILQKYQPTNTEFQQGTMADNGNYVMKYASGMAVMYLPFFTVAHILAGPLGYPRDGFSPPYQLAIQFGGLLISLIGLWYLRKLLLIYYNDSVVAITMVLLVIGSNYLNYSSIDSGMSHAWLFTLYVFLLLNTHYFYRSFAIKYAIRIGLLIGLATLTRPTDILSCLIPLLWAMESISPSAIKKQFALYISNYKPLAISLIAAACVISIQFIYWKYATGHWMFYSYQGQHLYFRSPNFSDYTFSYRSGWLIYSPMMAFAFIGIIPFLMNGKNKVAIIAFFLLNYYIVCSWSIWWYGGRAMIQSYPVLLFPVASLVQAAMSRKVLLWILSPVAVVLLYYNIWVTYVYHKGTLYDVNCMSEAYFWRVAGRWSAKPEIALLKENPDMYEGQPRNVQLIYRNDFEQESGPFFVSHANGKGKSLFLNKEQQNSPVFKFAFANKSATWLRATATFHCNNKEWESWKMAQFIVRLVNKDQKVKENMERVYRLLDDGETKNISLDMRLPRTNYDSIHVLFWNGGSDKPIWIDNLEVSVFNE